MADSQYFKKIIDAIVVQARGFLEEMGEFYPFGTMIDANGKIYPMGIFIEDDNPPSNILIEMLEKQIVEGITSGVYIMGSIGIDIYLNPENGKKDNAIEIRTLMQGKDNWGYVYLPYNIENKKVLFGEFKSF